MSRDEWFIRTAEGNDPTRFLPELAASLNNQSSHLAEAGRPTEGLAPINEAVTIRRTLAAADPTRFLPDLLQSVTNLCRRFSELDRPTDSVTAFDAVVDDHSDGWARGVVLLVRARWYAEIRTLADAAVDAKAAVTHLDAAGDRRRCGEARALLRRLRDAEPAAVNQQWPRDELPVWLRLPTIDPATEELLLAWVATLTWDESFDHLAEHAVVLLTDRAEASLEHLVDNNPDSDRLDRHLDLLRTARRDGVPATRDAVLRQVRGDRVRTLLTE